MTTSAIYHIQGIKKFKHISTKYKNGNCHQKIEASEHSCPKCGSPEVSLYAVRERIIRGQNLGRKKVFLHVQIHRLYCKKCQVTSYENLDFLPHPKSRLTSSLARTIIELRKEMTISAIAKHFGLDWDTVKEVELKWLKKKFRCIRMKDVKIIGMDEIHVGHEWRDGKRRQKYLTVVRDMCAGAVLFVGDGKGSDALAPFNARINNFKGNIVAVCMDMSNAYAKWVGEQLPNATVVYDHFHVIQLMNRKLDEIRRRVQAEMDDEAAKQLKGKRWLLLHKSDNLTENERLEVEALQHISEDLHEAWTLKEYLIKIYQLADGAVEARQMLMSWAGICKRMNAKELKTIGETVAKHLKGICAYWKFDRLTNAASEGFNNKIRHLISQAYGYRDFKYLKLKIYELPSMKLSKQLHSS
jgi:transposase